MDLLFLTFGPNIKNHYQANFCILSFLSKQETFATIHVYTDHPEFYRHLGSAVQITPLTQELLEEWKGEKQYVFRIKIKALENFICQHGQTDVVYLDSDTFLYHPTPDFQQLLSQNIAFMHEEEGKLHVQKSKTARKIWEVIQGKTFSGITISENDTMWNSGVIGIPAQRSHEAIQLALKLCDEMLEAGVTSFMLEQYVISVALNKMYTLQPAAKWIGHYWGNKEEWNGFISNFFLESHLKGYTLEQDITRLKDINLKQLPIRKQEKNTKLRLLTLLNKVFPPKTTIYLK